MIVREFYKERKDGVKLYRTYSNENYLIKKVGTEEVYSEAIDVETSNFEYIETEEKHNPYYTSVVFLADNFDDSKLNELYVEEEIK